MARIRACLMSESMEWETPKDLYDDLDNEYHFDLDPCCTDANAKCELHYTVRQNGLTKDWSGHRVFCNPPYGRAIACWVKKCYEESLKPDTLVVMLIPARTDTAYFHDYIYHRAKLIFIRGRLHFNDAKNGAPFPSMLVVFGAKKRECDLH